MHVLLIEDDDRVAGPLMEGLSRFGFIVEHARTGADGLAAAEAEMVLLDLGLPDMDGIDVCRTLRLRSQVPIIMISARNDEVDRVLGLELGADDYLSKPFGVRELVARIRAVFRRAGPAAAEPVAAMPASRDGHPVPVARAQQIGPLTLDRRGRRVRLHQTFLALSPKEFDLLAYLADDPGAVRTRQQILDAVWEPNYFGPTKTLDVHVAALRRKLGDPAWIDNIRGVGFRLMPSAGGASASQVEENTEGGER
ncbi:response regulator transcription factor [Streptomyces sioyaensis]|uniref:response regulator transcription factor n=1 Tax=Streptomyces sioyaensis TaxID=67364 RepID=UPI001F3DCF1F|nr:response regulator transcription factor [Streptomyces sioyaensis]MCF3176313.1 response regulator transcription factor [Streptomyces sioyaensis]